jgi:hypothetical protein
MLPIKAFQPVGKRMTLEGGGSGGGGNTTSTSTNMPEYAKPYYKELLKQTGKNIFETDAEGFVTGVKGAGELPQQTRVGMQDITRQGIQGIGNLSAPTQFAQSTQGLSAGQNLGYGSAVQGLNQAFAYDPNSAQRFGGAAANYYMNPYQQNVTDTALREAMQKGQIDKQAGAMGSIGRGTFGGARQALIQAEQGRGLNQQLADIQYRGASDAYSNAQQQFNADEQRRQQAQQYSATLGSQLGQAGLGAGLDASKALGALGSEQQQADLARLQAQVAAGEKQQAQMQGESDTDYQNRMAALNYEKQQLQFYSDILRGNANALGSTQVNYAPPPSAVSQVAGLGIAGLGLAKAVG